MKNDVQKKTLRSIRSNDGIIRNTSAQIAERRMPDVLLSTVQVVPFDEVSILQGEE